MAENAEVTGSDLQLQLKQLGYQINTDGKLMLNETLGDVFNSLSFYYGNTDSIDLFTKGIPPIIFSRVVQYDQGVRHLSRIISTPEGETPLFLEVQKFLGSAGIMKLPQSIKQVDLIMAVPFSEGNVYYAGNLSTAFISAALLTIDENMSMGNILVDHGNRSHLEIAYAKNPNDIQGFSIEGVLDTDELTPADIYSNATTVVFAVSRTRIPFQFLPKSPVLDLSDAYRDSSQHLGIGPGAFARRGRNFTSGLTAVESTMPKDLITAQIVNIYPYVYRNSLPEHKVLQLARGLAEN